MSKALKTELPQSNFKKETELSVPTNGNSSGNLTLSNSSSKNRSTAVSTFSQCDHCEKVLAGNVDHKCEVMPESSQKEVSLWNCSTCSLSFPSWMDLNLHKSSHTESFTCQNCCKSFARDRDLQKHRKTCWTEWICGHCNQVFDRHAFLRKHMKRKHSRDFPY